jgi:hypothetical protein
LGREIDFTRGFFEQFQDLLLAVPRNTMVNDNGLASENCEYTFNFAYGKNCYLVSTSWYAENCMYVSKSGRLLDVIDSDNVSESELLHACVSSNKLYNCQYLEDSRNCNNCFFGSDLRGCNDCFCCVGLSQKSFHIFNAPYSPQAYKEKLSAINLGSRMEVQNWQTKFISFRTGLPYRAISHLNCENCSGDRLANCRNTTGFGLWNAENVKYEDFGDTPKNSQDILVAGLCEWCYESQVPDHSSMICFTNYCWSCQDVFYSDDCRNCKNLFACVGLRQTEYCILNKQYSKNEYELLVPKLIRHMGSDFGEFFPAKISFFAYQETIAQDYLPIDQEAAKNLGFIWKKENSVNVQKPNIVTSIKDNISEVEAEDLANPIFCDECNKPFRIPVMELTLRQKINSPLPHACPSCRRLKRTQLMNPTKLVERNCETCGNLTLSRYESEVKGVHCQECFLKKVV